MLQFSLKAFAYLDAFQTKFEQHDNVNMAFGIEQAGRNAYLDLP